MSREYRGKRIVIYPSYIDSSLPRRLGRRVPREAGVPRPSIREIAEAAEELGLNPVVEEDARHPRTWFTHRGRVIVDKVAPKQRVLRMIAERILERRRRRGR